MSDSRRSRSLPSWLPLAAGLAAAVLGMVLLWALVIASDEDAERDDTASSGPRIVEPSELATAAERAGHPIYWAGEREGTTIELAQSKSGPVYVRYLAPGMKAGTRSADHMTVATYPVDDAVAALRRGLKKRPNAQLARGKDGAVVLIDPTTPGNVRLAYPGSDQQIELYTPDVAQSVRLATNGSIQPVP